jgi:hypothetical protein
MGRSGNVGHDKLLSGLVCVSPSTGTSLPRAASEDRPAQVLAKAGSRQRATTGASFAAPQLLTRPFAPHQRDQATHQP